MISRRGLLRWANSVLCIIRRKAPDSVTDENVGRQPPCRKLADPVMEVRDTGPAALSVGESTIIFNDCG
jgi:hypothetical protein